MQYDKYILQICEYLDEIKKKEKVELYFVGGFLRDKMLGINSFDIDIIVDGNCKKIATAFSRYIKGAFVVLDEKNKIYRVVRRENEGLFYFDFAKMQGKNLDVDLLRRDFTINTLALKISKKINLENIIDKTNAVKDLDDGLIRMVKDDAFLDDPLRMLRAYRFAGQYKFDVEKETIAYISKNKSLIKNVSSERIHDELIKFFSFENIFKYILKFDASGLLLEIFPDIKIMKTANDHYFHEAGLWGHTLEVLFCFEYIVKNLRRIFSGKVLEYLEKSLFENNNLALLKIACMFHDIGKPECFSMRKGRVRFFRHDEVSAKYLKKILQKLKFSNRDILYTVNGALYHMYAGNLAKHEEITNKACYRYFKKCDEMALGLLIITLADWLASIRGVNGVSYKKGIRLKDFEYPDFCKCIKAVNRLVEWKIEVDSTVRLKRIIDGKMIMKKFGLNEGKLIGEILDAVEEAQAEKKVIDEKTAFLFVEKWLVKHAKN